MDRDLASLGIQPQKSVYWDYPEATLYEEAIRRGEGKLARKGALVVLTGEYTGRSPKDRFIVREPATEAKIDWGSVNKPLEPRAFDQLYHDVINYISKQELFVQDLLVCAHPDFQRPVRVIAEFAWHSLFARNLFIAPKEDRKSSNKSGFTVIYAPRFMADPQRHGTQTGVFIVLNIQKRLVLIGGTEYAGEMKKCIFSMLNFLLPDEKVFPMHCSANAGKSGDVALFFGLSGTGKTTLSADPNRKLIGDDEHGWFDNGVFNFEGGCYAKAIGLKSETEPEIYRASVGFGSLLENVVLDPATRELDFFNDSITENTRSAYPIESLDLVTPEGVGGIPKTLFFLTYDAFGVLPPIARLTREQAIFYFLLGYTAKVAGTERGLTKPEATYSTCFGSPFLPRRASEYGRMLGQRLDQSEAQVWLLNTGITGGPAGVGKRMPLKETRALVSAAIDGTLERASFQKEPIFGLQVPSQCAGVSASLDPRKAWANPKEYDKQAIVLREQFEAEIKKFHGS
ncbi:phosphoenolpyruvate carboxykinase (ATP) [Candidatus Acetothermia bacterium]|nr:phosphoenolpyruvate carboxykinase (ATP) [Candidatus Acetothermia bacterium]MBI3643332.1 phosphoenolpyruvate carboxykinase (ATP) [Candidatus Acetothermia bacterium]